MKNTIYLFVVLALCGWNCADKKEVEPDIPAHEVSFAFSIVPGSLTKTASTSNQQSTTGDAIYDEVEVVTLYIYNSKGYLVGEYKRWRGKDANVFVTVLEEGEYTVVALGNGGDWAEDAARLNTARIHRHSRGQVFLDKAEFKVSASEKSEVSLVLKRKVGMLDIDITDQPMNDVYRVRVTIQNMAPEYAFHDFLPLGNEPISFAFLPHTNYDNDFPAYFYVPNNSPSYKTSILLELIDTSLEVRKTQWLRDVTLGVNMKTTIRGKFYDSKAHHFTVDVADEWNEEDIIDF